jgi:hypothetical protein
MSKPLKTILLAALAAALFGGQPASADHGAKPASARVEQGQIEGILGKWDKKPVEVARAIIAKYGLPDEATPSMLVWHNNGPWKRTIVYREEVPHSFPKPHTDIVEQFIDLRVPADKFDDLAAYDGSVIVERTKGEISARCDKEEMNFLALNLAKDIVDGKRSVKEARAFYGKTVMAVMKGEKAAYAQGFQFQLPGRATADPDRPTLKMATTPGKRVE